MKPGTTGSLARFTGVLSAITLIVDIGALAKLAFQVVAQGDLGSIEVQIVSIVVAFFVGLGLRSISLKDLQQDNLESVLRVYIWAYLILACVTYLGVAVRLRNPYSLSDYLSFLFIIGIQLGAFTILRTVSRSRNELPFAFLLLTVSVVHVLMFLYTFVFLRSSATNFVIGEFAFLFGWNLYAFPIIAKEMTGSGLRSRFRRK